MYKENGGSRHLEVFDGHSRVGKEALTNADFDPCLLHPLLQVVQSLSNTESQTIVSKQRTAEEERQPSKQERERNWRNSKQQLR